MTTDIAVHEQHDLAVANPADAASALTHYLGTGDLSRLSGEQKAALYLDTCRSLDLNPRTRPFDWIEFWDPETKAKKLALYPNRSCAEQLRRQHQISVRIVSEEIVGKLFKVVVEGRRPNGVTDTATSYVPLTDKEGNSLVGQRLANAFMKGQTTAKRRLTFSMVGMYSPPDLDELQRARVVVVDGAGRVLDNPTQEQRYLAQTPAAAAAIGAPTFETTSRTEDAPLAGSAGQQVRADELERPRSDGPRPSFRASDEDIKRRCGAWFGAVKGTSLDDDDARHRFVLSWTHGELEWPEAKRTDSLRTMFARMTEREAGDFLAHVRAICDEERSSYLDDAEQARSARPDVDQRVHDAVQLTGGPAVADGQADDEPAF